MSKEIVEDLKEIVLEKEKYLDSIEPDKFFQRRKLIKEISIISNAYNIIELQQQEIKELKEKQIDIKDFETYKKIVKATQGILILNPNNSIAYKLLYNSDHIINLVEHQIKHNEEIIDWENWIEENKTKYPLDIVESFEELINQMKENRIIK